MNATDRTVRVFISSTFKDMQAERDHPSRALLGWKCKGRRTISVTKSIVGLPNPSALHMKTWLLCICIVSCTAMAPCVLGQTEVRTDKVETAKGQGQNSLPQPSGLQLLWQMLRPGALLGPNKAISDVPGAIAGALTMMLYLAWAHPRRAFHEAAMRRMKYGADADVSLPSASGQAVQFLLVCTLGGLWLWGMPKRNLDWLFIIGPAVLASATAWASVTLWKRDTTGGGRGREP